MDHVKGDQYVVFISSLIPRHSKDWSLGMRLSSSGTMKVIAFARDTCSSQYMQWFCNASFVMHLLCNNSNQCLPLFVSPSSSTFATTLFKKVGWAYFREWTYFWEVTVLQTLLDVDWLEPLRDHTTVIATLMIISWNLKPVNPLTTDGVYSSWQLWPRVISWPNQR